MLTHVTRMLGSEGLGFTAAAEEEEEEEEEEKKKKP